VIDTAPARAPGRPRDPKADQAILDATIELLATEGFDEFSIEGVAARAGVGKTTVYRRWTSKVPLVVDAIRHHKPHVSTVIPRDMPTREAFVRLLSELVRAQGTEPADRILGGLVGAMARDPALAAAVREGLVSERRRTIVSLVRRGVERGEIRADADAELIADLLGGPILMRRLITGRPVTTRLARQIVAAVLDGMAP
jgi:AcrR family transcriptional regulator